MNNGANWESLSSGISLPTGEWHYLTCTYDGTTRKIYYDGILKTLIPLQDLYHKCGYIGMVDSSAAIGGNMDAVSIYPSLSPPKSLQTTPPVTSSSKQERVVMSPLMTAQVGKTGNP